MVDLNSKNGYFSFSLFFCPLVEMLVTEQEKGQKKASETWPLNKLKFSKESCLKVYCFCLAYKDE